LFVIFAPSVPCHGSLLFYFNTAWTSELSKPHQPGSEIAKGGGEIAKVPDQTEATLQSLENTIPCPVFCPSRLEGSMRLI
jgi:hypothetical protein